MRYLSLHPSISLSSTCPHRCISSGVCMLLESDLQIKLDLIFAADICIHLCFLHVKPSLLPPFLAIFAASNSIHRYCQQLYPSALPTFLSLFPVNIYIQLYGTISIHLCCHHFYPSLLPQFLSLGHYFLISWFTDFLAAKTGRSVGKK